MFLRIENNIESEYENAIKYFPENYINSLSSKESIVSRYIISKEIEKSYKISNYLLIFDNKGIPLFDNGIFWSISHKENLVFVGVDDEKIGTDIEVYKERDSSVFDQFKNEEYNILGGKSWDNFYMLWTAKESAIKFNFATLNELSKIKLIEVNNCYCCNGELYFSKKILLNYKSSINQVYFGKKDNVFYSVCTNSVIE